MNAAATAAYAGFALFSALSAIGYLFQDQVKWGYLWVSAVAGFSVTAAIMFASGEWT